uniref:Anthocyanin 5-aromatic acyltransferase n=2 Tax=Cajanus cajan TaxID=3821 RepID=A0A151SGX2_CAJCA|nr:Anthocyanin 5-aromatic acyltransferase [Cajanus cajan]
MSVEFTISESNGDFKQFCSNHPRDAKDFHLLVPKLASSISSSEVKEFPLLAIQVTLFPNVGICIGLACHTVVADGRTFHNFMKTWASHCTFGSASAFPTNSLPLCDRSVIVNEKGLEEVFLEEWTKRRLEKNIAIGREANLVDLSSMVRATFSMSITQMEKMKLLIINYCKEKNKPRLEPVRLTSYVLICAFVWVCLVKTHQSVNEKANHEDPTYFGFIAGGMTRLDYPVQQTYLGNCVGFYRASERREELLGENGIVVAAIAIVSVVKKLDALYFDGADKWILDWEVLHGSEQHVHAVWSPKLKFYELDFGWGRPKKIEEVSIDHTRAVSVIHSREFEGEIEIGLALPKSKMDVFSSLFTQGLSALL